jgi:hypothetical protein
MGVFGGTRYNYDPRTGVKSDEPSVGDRIINQIGANLLGVNMLADKRKKALAEAQGAFMDDLGQRLQGQPEGDVQVPISNSQGQDISAAFAPQMQHRAASPPLDVNSAELPALALRAQRLGIPMTQLLEVLKAQQPNVQYDRGYGYNQKTGVGMGDYHPDLDKGMVLGRNGVQNLPGYVDAASQAAGSVTSAQEGAKAGWDLVDVPLGNGQTVKLPRAVAAPILAKSFADRGGAPAGIGVGQSPAQTAADTTRATAGAQADVNLPQSLSTAQQALGLIKQLKSHPALNARTGLMAILPAIPGTSGADFDAMAAQLKGKVFLQAYGDLKGAGQITEVEGKKATDAIARLNQTQTKEGYLKALSDLEEVISTGAGRAQAQAGRLQPNAGGPGGPARPNLSSIPVADRLAEARRRGLIK